MFNLGDIIGIAVRIEQNGEKVYTKAAKGASDPLLCSVFAKLASDEIEHGKWFEALRAQAEITGIAPALEDMGKTMLQDIVGDKAFSLTETDLSEIKNIKALLDAAIEFEKDSIIFYEMIAGFVTDDKAINGLKIIIEEENRHVRQLIESFAKGEFSRGDKKYSPA
jgi:rubrerythrin